jgi:tetratricopeptide (TPR) repeat protein
MRSTRPVASLGAAALLSITVAALADAPHGAMTPATGAPPLFTDRGSYHFAIKTTSPDAQRYFDQGMRLMFGFNLEEAERSFERAEQLDSTCAMCAWGTAFSLGPHINLAGLPERTVKANAAVRRAQRLAGNAAPLERALIDAMAKRYSDPAPTDAAGQAKLDQAYAEAMHEVLSHYPDNPDVCVLWAEAAMDVHPWDLYTPDGQPKAWTPEIVATLEKALAEAPDHVGANHLYIHAVEASTSPGRALASAKRLESASPGEPHLVHMPAHIYHRLGRFDQSAEVNRRAIVADDQYRKTMNPQGFYLMYAAHNHQFLMWSCWMAGRYEESLREARAIPDIFPLDMLRQMPGNDYAIVYPSWTFVRFGHWQEVLDEPSPPSDFAYARGVWHAARAIAEAELGRLAEAAADRDSAASLASALPADALEALNSAKTLMGIATDMATGVIAAKQGDTDMAVKTLEGAVAAEDQLRYNEPSDWYIPVRHVLGAVLLAAGRAADAQQVYERDLERNVGNAWALAGLAQSLRAQRKGKQATVAEARALKASKDADVKIAASWP